ncbi:hypothetical protein AU255_06895 [Methyloprofundus sedimenti]|uniref:Uncharacterized protein n=1 Tax=Methyloprofundus sedimenti TaxID=1420851 RepID=A0A1V8M7U0_9GAMM|nr:hypothetical protein [Methyloprofundus sedimenti]OQK17592.1 hypothetical protein AU255_06895 [Methyloprofundus sedimenti]
MLTFPLSGINAAMLQKQQVMQLPADDPLAFAEYAEFAQRVKNAVGQQRTTAPDPTLDFHPIQSGALELRRLRLIDNFGQSREQSVNKIERTERLEVAQHDNLVSLPVRLSQSARLEFRLLQAAEKIKDASEHHNRSPVCGWLTVNDLDELIMVHDAKGHPLGTLNADSDLIWQPAPGMERPLAPAMFSNPTLRRVIEWLIRQGGKFIDLFAHTLENSLDTIHPENFGADEWALMSGRPLAIVQVKVELLLKGLPANDQGYGAFHRDLHSGIRDSAGYENVKFPVRIGDHRQVNDGLVGYWREDNEERLSKQFHAPNANAVEMAQQETGSSSKTENKIIGATEPPLIPLSIRQPAQILTLLIDPRGHLQATSGILPQKSITLPKQFYSEALAKMRPIFLTAPVLTPSDKLTLPLPRHHGLHWDWLERRREQWERTDQQAISEPAAASGASSAKQEIREGWLELNPNKQDNENN